MTFKECVQSGFLVETGDKDLDKASELLALTEHKLHFWKDVDDKASKYPSLFIEGHYEIIKELIIAILAIDGWKSTNHDCLFQYLVEKKKDLELDFPYLDELRKLRNKIDYHGTKISPETWKQNKLKLQITIQTLQKYVRKNVA